MCVQARETKEIKWKMLGQNGFLIKTVVLKKILIFYLRRQVMGCFGPGVKEQAGEVPLGERP